MRRVAIRADASVRIGSGHVMRCLTLAEALRAKGVEVRFVCRDHPGHLADRLKAAGLPVAWLPAPPAPVGPIADGDYVAWLGVPVETDAAETVAALDGWRPDWLVVDHYALGADWEGALRPHGGAILAVDDLANRPHDCDLLLDQNLLPEGEARYRDLVPATTRVLSGPRFALMRPEYAAMRRRMAPRDGHVARVLVYYGASDPTGETVRALRVLSQATFRHLGVDVVLGANAPDRAAVEALANARPGTVLHHPRPHLADLMARADLALGGGGATSWERCCLGLPTLITVQADNQRDQSVAQADAGAARVIGRAGSVSDADISAALEARLSAPDAVARAAMAAARLTDGDGVSRVLETVAPSPSDALRLRKAGPEDAAALFVWLNDPETRRQSFNPNPVSWEEHDRWLARALGDPNRSLYVVETSDGLAVGQVRLDRVEDGAVISYGLDPIVRGRGWGARVLDLAVAAWQSRGDGGRLHGFVRPDNLPSIRSFRRAGFEPDPEPHDRGPETGLDMVWPGEIKA
jgi:UDP-2,4-diacetamido-2,4,6-trideoxy-beta-L-altropyranose hydrolase